MKQSLTVGEFSRMTHLSVKTLRHYHQVGLLEPDQVDPDTGYRYYALDQIPAGLRVTAERGAPRGKHDPQR